MNRVPVIRLCNPNCAVYVWLRAGETRRTELRFFKGCLAAIRSSRCRVLHSSFCGKDRGERGPPKKTRATFSVEQRPSLSLRHLDPGRTEARRNKGLKLRPQVMQSSTGNGVQGCGRAYLLCLWRCASVWSW